MHSEKPINRVVDDNLSDNICDLSCLELTRLPVDVLKQNESITILNLHKNNITRLGLDFATLTNICKLDLSNNGLISLPYNFGKLINLTSLNLYDNNLISLPLSFGNLKNLHFLDLRCNCLDSDLEAIAGKGESVRACEQCAIEVVHYFRDGCKRLSSTTTLKGPKQADEPRYAKGTIVPSVDYIYMSQTDDSCSEISLSDFTQTSDTECEDNISPLQVSDKSKYLCKETIYRDQEECHGDNTIQKSQIVDSNDETHSKFDGENTTYISEESNVPFEQANHEAIDNECNDNESNEDDGELNETVSTEEQQIDLLKTQKPVEVVVARGSKEFIKWFLRFSVVVFIVAAIFFTFKNFNFFGNFFKGQDSNSTKLIGAEIGNVTSESDIQDKSTEQEDKRVSLRAIKENIIETVFEKIMAYCDLGKLLSIFCYYFGYT